MCQSEQNELCFEPDGAARPKLCSDYELGCTRPPCPRARSVWFIPVLSRGLHPGLGCGAKKNLLIVDYVININLLSLVQYFNLSLTRQKYKLGYGVSGVLTKMQKLNPENKGL